ncbi:hypothetical protein [Streptomyces marokkonensis]|uniref:hypothetical protein n=1 Tax=Streptomyces marokkonensis TaxID=324855 RepID=UPI001FCB3389|nr:hypothetical protein [Streptomyces marokkonensis]
MSRSASRRLPRIPRPLPPPLADLLIAVVVGVFTGSDAAVNDPGHRQADWVTWLLFAVSTGALLVRSRWPVAVAVVTGAACAGWALYGHIGEPLNLPVSPRWGCRARRSGRSCVMRPVRSSPWSR